MIAYPAIDPVAIDLGFFQIHWYGLMYLLGFAAGYWVGIWQVRTGRLALTTDQVSDLLFYIAMGLVLGGRLGYAIFYGWDHWANDFFWVFRLWEGGMAFHGGFLGVAVAIILFAYKHKVKLASIADLAALAVPPGLGTGRLGNFIGQELWGRPTDSALGMVFPADPLGLARHPSQLYQFLLEGVVLFLIILWFTRKPRPQWSATALFLIFYGIFRFSVEFVREPDAHIGLELFGWMTRGQILSLPMFVVGIMLLVWAYKTQPHHTFNNAKR